MKTDLQSQMERDLEFLKKAFPHLQEAFPCGKWICWVRQPDLGTIIFRDDDARIVQISIQLADKTIYSVCSTPGTDCEFPTIYAAVEFIGRMAHGLTPIDASAAALEARFGSTP